MLQDLINSVKAKVAELEAFAAKGAQVAEADLVKAKNAVEAELEALLNRLRNL